jgi:hypothetical protein
MGIDGADPVQRPKDTRQFRIDQGQRNLIPTVGVEKNKVCYPVQVSTREGKRHLPVQSDCCPQS